MKNSFLAVQSKSEPRWLKLLRKNAFERFQDVGFPTLKDEQWRHTSLAPLTQTAFKGPPKKSIAPKLSALKKYLFDDLDCHRLTFVNGSLAPRLSQTKGLPKGIQLFPLIQGLKKYGDLIQEYTANLDQAAESSLQSLNTAMMTEGVVLSLGREATLGKPLHLLHISTKSKTPFMIHPRNVIIAPREAQAVIIESYVSLGDSVSWTNATTDLVVGPYSVIDHYRIQQESPQGFHIARLNAFQQAHSQVNSHNYSWGAALSRDEIHICLDGEDSECRLYGLYMGKNKQHTDHHTVIEHLKPRTKSTEIYKGILNNNSRGVFNGKIFVETDAQQTDAQQTNKNLILSDNAVVNTRPQLEIYADDVKCSHGATIGRLDEESLFYLRTRGIGLKEARHLLTLGFASEILDNVHVPAVKRYLENLLKAELL